MDLVPHFCVLLFGHFVGYVQTRLATNRISIVSRQLVTQFRFATAFTTWERKESSSLQIARKDIGAFTVNFLFIRVIAREQDGWIPQEVS